MNMITGDTLGIDIDEHHGHGCLVIDRWLIHVRKTERDEFPGVPRWEVTEVEDLRLLGNF
jgi:hypothetical protein